MKILAMYLPQFHHVKENDEWWGKGFTDWEAAKRAKPLFEGHYQPHVPMNHNYYDLLEKKTMQWQADLMHQYGVDGMCIYHYWFKDGRQILEKPVENLLKWKEIDMPFCFCWANETWARSWGNIKNANSWADVFDKKNENGEEKSILLDQKYGKIEDWEKHYLYFLPYIKDERYIRYEGRPVLVIYKPKLIYCLQEMIRYWKELAKKYNQKEFYIIGMTADSTVTPEVDAMSYHQPAKGMNSIKKRTGKRVLDYAEVWENILQDKRSQRKTYDCGFIGYDSTPRKGKKGTIVNVESPELFKKYLKRLLIKSEFYKNEYVFLNAWNEWGEGMHLEPDEKYGMAYLEALYEAKKEYIEELDTYKQAEEKNEDCEKITAAKNEVYLSVFDKWMSINRKCSVNEFLQKKGISKVALYGWGTFSKQLVEEFSESGIEIVCIIDKDTRVNTRNYPLHKPDDVIPDCDIVIVCSFYYYYEIMKNKYNWYLKAVSFEKLLQEMEECME